MENFLSFFRILITFPVVFLILEKEFFLAFWLYLVGALTDWFDGNLARKNKRVSNFGKLLDPYADKVFVLLPLIALVEVKKVKAIWVILLTFRELSISFFRSVMVEKGIYMEASFTGKLKAFLEFSAISLILLGVELGNYLLILAVIFAYISAFGYLKRFWALI